MTKSTLEQDTNQPSEISFYGKILRVKFIWPAIQYLAYTTCPNLLLNHLHSYYTHSSVYFLGLAQHLGNINKQEFLAFITAYIIKDTFIVNFWICCTLSTFNI